MWPDLGKSNILQILSKLQYLYRMSYKFAKYEYLQLYRQWATALCNPTINIANIEKKKWIEFLKYSHTFQGINEHK